MSYRYPVDVDLFAQRIEKRGDAVVRHFALAQAGEREDQKLRQIVRRGGKGWFPVMADRSFHGAVDLGLVAVEGDTLQGTPVRAIADGEVVFCDNTQRTEHDYDVGRVIVRHTSPDGKEVFVLYQHLGEVKIHPNQRVAAGDELGTIGWHGDYPHVHVAVASPHKLGDDVLGTEAKKEQLPADEKVWSVRRVQVAHLDEAEWLHMPSADTWYLYDPIEFVRFCRGEQPLPDVGSAAHQLEATPQPAVEAAATLSQPNVHEVPELLRSEALKGCAELQQLAADPDFAALGEGAPKAIVEAVQTALVALGFQLPEGTRGTWCAATKTAVERFEKDSVLPADWSWMGRTKDDVKVDGSLDWLTLLALDSALVEKAKGPAPAAPAPAAQPPPRPASATPASGAKKSGILFDASDESDAALSLDFGLKMYQAHLRWIEDRCGYSTAHVDGFSGYVKPAEAKDYSEWPLMNGFLDDDLAGPEVTVDGVKRKTYRLFGASWVSSNFANCSISQMAAFAAAVRGRPFQVRARYDDMDQHKNELFDWAFDPKGGSATPTIRMKVKSKVAAVDRLRVFETLMMSNAQTRADDKALYEDDKCGLGSAVTFMKIGRMIAELTKDFSKLKHARISDLAATTGHAFMVGDVRYAVTFEAEAGPPKKKEVTLYVDQCCFIEHAEPQFFAKQKDAPISMDERLRALLAGDTATFDKRVKDFLKTAEEHGTFTIDGAPRKVKAISIAAWRVLSANCVWGDNKRTARSKIVLRKSTLDVPAGLSGYPRTVWVNDRSPNSDFKEDDQLSEDEVKKGSVGLTNYWRSDIKTLTVARFYKLGTATL